MRLVIAALLLGGCVAVTTGCAGDGSRSGSAAAAALTSAKPVVWSVDRKDAQQRAAREHKLVMVDFYTDSCVFCKVLDERIYPDPIVQAAMQQFIPIRLNAEKEGRPLASDLDVHGFPTLVFLDERGNAVDRIVGVARPAEFAAKLNKISQDYQEFPGLEAYIAAHPSDREYRARWIYGLIQRGDIARAEPALKTLSAEHATTSPDSGELSFNLAEAMLSKRDPRCVAWYRVGANIAADTMVKVKCHAMLSEWYEVHGDFDHLRQELRDVIALRDAPDGLRDRAKEMLARLNKDHPAGRGRRA